MRVKKYYKKKKYNKHKQMKIFRKIKEINLNKFIEN